MTRRLRIAGTAFGAMLVPACAGFQPDATVMHPPVSTQPVAAKAAPSVVGPVQAARPRTVEKFAEGRTAEPIAIADRPRSGPPAPAPSGRVLPVPSASELTKVEAKIDAPALADPPRIMVPSPERDVLKPAPEPVPDADAVIRPNWPTIKGVPLETPRDEPKLTLPAPGDMPPGVNPPVAPPSDRAPVAAPAVIAPPPMAAPPPLPPGVIGSSVHKSNASPESDVILADAMAPVDSPMTRPVTGGSAVLRAVQAFQENKPDEAVEHLKAYDPATQQILLSLLPALGRLGEGKLQQMKPEEMDVLLAQLTKVPNMLRPRASLQANNVRLCREVHNFAHVEPFPERHTFRPGDIVYLYLELANFSCGADPAGGYAVTLATSLELRDAAGSAAWKADPKDVPDKVSSPPQDYYRNFRLSVPNVPAGTYTLVVKTTDRPTGREVQKSVEMRVGAK